MKPFKQFAVAFSAFLFLATPALAGSSNALVIFDDALAPGWNNWSWGSYVDFNLSSPVQSGTNSLGFYPAAWGGLYLHSGNPVDTTPYTGLTFALNTVYQNQKFQVTIYGLDNKPLGSASLDKFGGDPPVGSWKVYTIPLSALNASNKQISGIVLQNSANYSELVYADYLALVTQNDSAAPIPTSSVAPVTSSQNLAALSAANAAYDLWKSTYVQSPSTGVLRVIRPENQNDTVSEGMGYGMLLSLFANDQQTFSGLFNYTKQYLDQKGLMNWQVSSNGVVIGQGSATDADEDIAYALLRAEAKWPGQGYGQAAKEMIRAMLQNEVLPSNLINPGDNWGNTQIVNPSYLAPAYYRAFAQISADPRWNSIAEKTGSWEQSASNSSSGLLPDWLNADLSSAPISWDLHKNDFYYDALRAPIRLLMDYKWNNSQAAFFVLDRQNNFVSTTGLTNLKSGYTLSGTPLTSYIDSAFLGAYASMGQINPQSQFAKDSLNALIQSSPNSYFSASIKALALYVIGGAR